MQKAPVLEYGARLLGASAEDRAMSDTINGRLPMDTIEKGVPIPLQANTPLRRYPWAEMEVGDSFFAPIMPGSISGQIRNAQRRHGHKYTTRKVCGGVRVWRIA